MYHLIKKSYNNGIRPYIIGNGYNEFCHMRTDTRFMYSREEQVYYEMMLDAWGI